MIKPGLLLCVLALGIGVSVGQGLTIPVPDTIMLPDSLGPLRPPYHVAFGSSTDNIYVASESSDIIVVDGNTFQRIERIYTGVGVGDAMLVDQHNRLYVSHPSQGRIGVIDCATNTIVGSIQGGTRPKLLCYSSGSDKLYCGDTIDHTVTVIDCAADTVRKVISVGRGLTAMAYDPTTSKVYAATRDAVRAISCSGDSVVSTISAVKAARGLCINQRRQKLYVVGRDNPRPDTIYVISTESDSLIAEMVDSVRVGLVASCLVCNEATDRLYGTVDAGVMKLEEFDCSGDTLIRSKSVTSNITTAGLICDTTHGRLYYLHSSDGWVRLLVVDCATLGFVRLLGVGTSPIDFQVDSTGHRLMSACGRRDWSDVSRLEEFDYGGDSIYMREAVPLSGWTQAMVHNPATNRLYCGWGGGSSVLDERTNCVVGQVFRAGRELTCSPTSRKFYFPTQGGIGVMDALTDSVLKVIAIGNCDWADYDPFPCWCPDGDKLYLYDGANGYITVIDCHTDSAVREIDVNDLVGGFQCLDNGRMLCNVSSRLDLIDTRTDSIVVDSAIAGVYAVAHTGDGNKVYLVRYDRLEVRSSSTLSLLSTISWPQGGGNGSFLVYSDTTRKLYWFKADDSALVIDATSDTVVARMNPCTRYNCACLDHTGRYLFHTAYADSTVSLRVLDTRSDSLVGSYPNVWDACTMQSSPEQHCIYIGCIDMILAYPDVPPGVEETPNAEMRALKSGPTVVREVLVLNELGTRSELSDNSVMSRAALLDVGGRKVIDLRSGANDVRALAPGVYFVRTAQAQAQAQAVRKIVLTE
jgi:DNA-binding beta-propeller fold protein YncE